MKENVLQLSDTLSSDIQKKCQILFILCCLPEWVKFILAMLSKSIIIYLKEINMFLFSKLNCSFLH